MSGPAQIIRLAVNRIAGLIGINVVRAASLSQINAHNEQLARECQRLADALRLLDGRLAQSTDVIRALRAAQEASDATQRALAILPWMSDKQARITAACVTPPDFDAVLADVMGVLTDSGFAAQPVARQVDLLELINACMMATGHAQASAVALVMARHVGRLLRAPGLVLSNACRLYDALFQTWWCSAASLDDMRPVYAYACLPFHGFLERQGLPRPAGVDNVAPPAGRPLRIAYLFHYAHGQRGNSVAPLMYSLAVGHAKLPDRQVFAYAVQAVDEDWLAKTFTGTGVITRSIPQWQTYQRMDELFEQFRSDGIDVIVGDAGTSITAYLFARRAAPVQLWIDMGNPYIYFPEMDLVLQPGKRWRDCYPGTRDQSMEIHLYQHQKTLFREPTPTALAEARESVPSGAKIIAVCTRLCKITPDYLAFARAALLRHPGTHMLIVGTGDPRLVEEFVTDDSLSGRVTFIHRAVDLAAYAQIMHLFLDTFPFLGAITGREIAAQGVPIAGVRTHEWDRIQEHDRDPESIAADLPALARMVDRLLTDPAYHLARSQAARSMTRAGTDIMPSVYEMEKAVDVVWQKRRRARRDSDSFVV